jgi:four helix bundle protein
VLGSDFRRLAAYQLAAEISDELAGTVTASPSFQLWSIGIQLMRAADSIGANIAEASGRWSRADQRHLLIVARGSLYELEHWYSEPRAQPRGLGAGGDEVRLAELARLINGLIKRQSRS